MGIKAYDSACFNLSKKRDYIYSSTAYTGIRNIIICMGHRSYRVCICKCLCRVMRLPTDLESEVKRCYTCTDARGSGLGMGKGWMYISFLDSNLHPQCHSEATLPLLKWTKSKQIYFNPKQTKEST